MSCAGLNQIGSLDVPTGSLAFGAAFNASTYAADKSVELHSSNPYTGSYVLYGSHDGTLFVPLLSFDSGNGNQQFKQELGLIVQFLKLQKRTLTRETVTSLVAGQAACVCTGQPTANKFISLGGLNVGSSGPQAIVDLFSVVPATGLDAGFNIMCGGSFVGLIGIEGSLNGTDFAPCGVDMSGNAVNGFSISQKGGVSAPATELSPIIVPNVVRYIRVNVQATLFGPVSLTIGGKQNCDCQ